MKDIFYFWDIATFFPSVFFSLKEPWFSSSLSLTKLRNHGHLVSDSFSEHVRAIVNRSVEKTMTDPIQRLHTYVTIIGPHIE